MKITPYGVTTNTSAPRTGAQIIVDALLAHDVDTVFGYTGASVMPLFDRLYDLPIRVIAPCHEQGGCHMADAYARAGGGIVNANAAQELREFAIQANLPVTMTLMGLGCYDQGRPESLDMLGMHGTAYANFAVQECDLLIAMGAPFDDRVTGRLEDFAARAKIIHIDIDPAEDVYPMVPSGRRLHEHGGPEGPRECNVSIRRVRITHR